MNSAKLELRKVLKAKRLTLKSAQRAQKSQAIAQKLIDYIDWSKIGSIHCFEPIEALGEVDIISHLEDKNNVFTSKQSNGEWVTVLLGNNAPVPESFDLIIVPMLGFDDDLHRIGYGGGYYDKFLAAQPKAQKIGVCFEAGHVERVPAETHDIPLDVIITESNTYNLLFS